MSYTGLVGGCYDTGEKRISVLHSTLDSTRKGICETLLDNRAVPIGSEATSLHGVCARGLPWAIIISEGRFCKVKCPRLTA
jgi:hypothetical protein